MTLVQLDFQKSDGLIPAIVQDCKTKTVLMLGYMNQESYLLTQQTGLVTFWSRSRQKIWNKGEESGNTLNVESIAIDCDGDTILIQAELLGSAVCHTGKYSCFFTNVFERKL